MEDKEAMANLTNINLPLSQILTQAQENILVLSKHLQALQTQAKAKIPNSESTVLDKKTKETKWKSYCWTHGKTCSLDHTIATYRFPKTGHQVGATLGNKMGGSEKFKEDKSHEQDGGARNTVVEKINYNHHLSLIQKLPAIST